MTTSARARAVASILAVRGLGPARLRQVLARARERGIAPEEVPARAGDLGDVLSRAQIDQLETARRVADEIAALEADGIRLVSFLDEDYPRALGERLRDQCPPLLSIAGNRDLLEAPSAGFCGSRAASPRGLEVARDCADQLSRAGCVVVSGYAAGVDLQAHRSALEAGRSTVIVLAEGMRCFRVKGELRSAWSAERTCVVSEFPAGARWSIANAMQRNRTIVGLSHVMILIEAGATGGSIAAGRTALDLGVPLFAPEYDGMPASATGNRELLSRGARPLWRSRATDRARLDEVIQAMAAAPSVMARQLSLVS